MPGFKPPRRVPPRMGAPRPLPPGIRLRDARPEDAEALHALYHAAYHPDQDPHRTRPLKDTVEDVRGYLREHALLVAEDEATGALLATVQLRAIANVRRLAVSPDAKGLGLGSALLDAALARAADDAFDLAELDTQPDHPWLAPFYARHGFEVRGVEELADGSRWLVMRKRLP